MGNLFTSLLNSQWGDYFRAIFGEDSDAYKAATGALNAISTALWIILAAVGVAGIIYSVWLGVKLARAEDQSKRDEAKKHLITVVISVGVTLILIVFFNTVLPLILKAFNSNPAPAVDDGEFIGFGL